MATRSQDPFDKAVASVQREKYQERMAELKAQRARERNKAQDAKKASISARKTGKKNKNAVQK